jgi:hypothetical protein
MFVSLRAVTNNYSVYNILSPQILFGSVGMYKAMTYHVVLCGCETWSHTLRKEHTPREFESRLLMRIFGPKRDEIIGRWEKMHNVELHNSYSLPDIRVRIAQSVQCQAMSWRAQV